MFIIQTVFIKVEFILEKNEWLLVCLQNFYFLGMNPLFTTDKHFFLINVDIYCLFIIIQFKKTIFIINNLQTTLFIS